MFQGCLTFEEVPEQMSEFTVPVRHNSSCTSVFLVFPQSIDAIFQDH